MTTTSRANNQLEPFSNGIDLSIRYDTQESNRSMDSACWASVGSDGGKATEAMMRELDADLLEQGVGRSTPQLTPLRTVGGSSSPNEEGENTTSDFCSSNVNSLGLSLPAFSLSPSGVIVDDDDGCCQDCSSSAVTSCRGTDSNESCSFLKGWNGEMTTTTKVPASMFMDEREFIEDERPPCIDGGETKMQRSAVDVTCRSPSPREEESEATVECRTSREYERRNSLPSICEQRCYYQRSNSHPYVEEEEERALYVSSRDEDDCSQEAGLSSDENHRPRSRRSALTPSKSVERRLNEAAQFAEALGEMPPTNVNEMDERLQIIDGSSDDDEDDEDDDEQLVEREVVERELAERELVEKEVKNRRISKPSFNKRLQRTPPSHLLQCLLGGLPTAYGEDPQPAPFVYRGICSNPPEVTRSGMSRGNYAQLHRKAWLEVSDKYHRYGKNLRRYYKHWETLGHPTNKFFDWLDSKGEAAGQPLPNLEECPRSQLDSDTVLYINNAEWTAKYALTIQRNHDNSTSFYDAAGDPIQTGEDGWIFVLRDGTFYAAPKVTSVTGKAKKRFHHSSFFGGKAVAAAGIIITDPSGRLQKLYPHSGHYRPGEAHLQRVLFYLQKNGFELCSFDVDMQQILRVVRNKNTGGEDHGSQRKAKKVNSLYLMPATCVAGFLTHKALMIGEGVFEHIHKVRRLRRSCISRSNTKESVGGGDN